MIGNSQNLDIAQRIAQALARTFKPRIPAGKFKFAFKTEADTVTGQFPKHLRHLSNLLEEVSQETCTVDDRHIEASLKINAACYDFFRAAFEQYCHSFRHEDIYGGIKICSDWRVVGFGYSWSENEKWSGPYQPYQPKTPELTATKSDLLTSENHPLDIAQRLAEAVARTDEPEMRFHNHPKREDEIVFGEVPKHLRHLYNLVGEVDQETYSDERIAVHCRLALLRIAHVALRHHFPSDDDGDPYNGVWLCENWQVVGLSHNMSDDEMDGRH